MQIDPPLLDKIKTLTKAYGKLCDIIDLRHDRTEIEHISFIKMPFGKYNGARLSEIPLGYLDHTVSSMPCSYLTRTVRRFVELAMSHPMLCDTAKVPKNKSYDDIESEWCDVRSVGIDVLMNLEDIESGV